MKTWCSPLNAPPLQPFSPPQLSHPGVFSSAGTSIVLCCASHPTLKKTETEARHRVLYPLNANWKRIVRRLPRFSNPPRLLSEEQEVVLNVSLTYYCYKRSAGCSWSSGSRVPEQSAGGGNASRAEAPRRGRPRSRSLGFKLRTNTIHKDGAIRGEEEMSLKTA